MQKFEHNEENLLNEVSPEEKAALPRWLVVLFLFHGLWALASLYNLVNTVILVLDCVDCGYKYSGAVFQVLNILLVPMAVYLAWQKRKTGWMLLYGYSWSVIIATILSTVSLSMIGLGFNLSPFLLLILAFQMLTIRALSMKKIKLIYGIDTSVKRRSIMIMIGCMLMGFALILVLSLVEAGVI